ncbi:protein SON-like isoform X1 [Zingiber officinale]|uniref:protein SON-like isoform X1 n=1 Tax=Zingiber officinale TaxID=94328 RepID=UPI001C4AAAE5|nr:protein SON-like isoform X1 [Zingiber officinale]
MDSFQGRRFAGGGGGDLQQPQQNPFPNPYHHQPQSHSLPASSYPFPPPPPNHNHYPSPPPPPPPHHISSQNQPPPPQWVHPDGHFQQQQQHHPAFPPPYPSPYAAQPVQQHQYPPHSSLHHAPQMQPPPLPPSAYPPPPHQGWGGQSWPQNQAWEYSERNLTYNAVDDWAARAKAWATAKSGTDIHHSHPQVVPEGKTEVHSHTYRDQYQATMGPPTDAQQSLLSQSTNQQPPHFSMNQQKQVDHAYLSASLASGPIYVGDMHIHSTTGEEAAAQRKDHTSPGENFGRTPSIFEQEVPYSYSSIPGNRDTVSKLHLPALSTQKGFAHPPPAFTNPNVAVDQYDLTHCGQSAKYATDPSNMPLDFESRPLLGLESHSKISYVPIPSESMGMMDHDAITMPAHAWAPPAAPAVLPQVSISESVSQLDHPFVPHPTLGPQPSPVYGRLMGPEFRPSVPPTSPPFGLVTGTSLNHATIMPADASANFNLSGRPKKAAVPNWLREEIIKNKSSIASTYVGHQSGNSYNSMGLEDDDKLYRTGDQIDNKSADSTKSSVDEDDDEDGAEAVRSAAVNQEIKRVLTEVLLKVTDELFDEIAMKVLDEDDLIDEMTENKELGNLKVPIVGVSTTKASAKVLATVEEDQTENGVHVSSGMRSPAGDILGLASYASDEDEDEDVAKNSKSLSVNESRSSENEPRNGEIEKNLNNKGPLRDPDGVANGRLESIGSSKSNSRNHVANSVRTDPTVSDSKLPNRAKEPKDSSVTSSQHLPHKNDLPSEISSDGYNVSESKGKTVSNKVMKVENALTANAVGESLTAEEHARELKKFNSSERYPEKRSYSKETVKKESHITGKSISEVSDCTETINYENKRLKESAKGRNNSNDTTEERSKRRANSKESDAKGHDSINNKKMGVVKDKKERDKEDTERKTDKSKDNREGKSKRDTKDSRYVSRKSPSQRSRSSKEGSLHSHGISNDESCEVSKRRRMHSRSPSPSRSKARQVSRPPNRKHSHHRHSPYSSERRLVMKFPSFLRLTLYVAPKNNFHPGECELSSKALLPSNWFYFLCSY